VIINKKWVRLKRKQMEDNINFKKMLVILACLSIFPLIYIIGRFITSWLGV